MFFISFVFLISVCLGIVFEVLFSYRSADFIGQGGATQKPEIPFTEQKFRQIIKKRGYEFGRERKDDYVGELIKFIRHGGTRDERIIDRMLFAAMIEARSCERFKVLTENIKDEELKVFYKELMISEANHYTTFIKFARQLGDPEKVNIRWEEWLEYEAEIIKSYGKKESIHG